MKVWTVVLVCVLVCGVWVTPAEAAQTARLIVAPDGLYTTPQAALAVARAGDVIEVHAGTYAGPLVVDLPVTFTGVDWPVIDGGEHGTVVTLNAPETVFTGFVVRASGVEPDTNDAGILMTAARQQVTHNRLSDVLFGVIVNEADEAVISANDITSKAEYELGRKGDAIRVWYSARVQIMHNDVHSARDIVLWYAEDVDLRENRVAGGRYGVHFMYCNGARIERNFFLENSIGVFAMYSHDFVIRDNFVRGHRGPSGYALGFKDSENVVVSGNVLVDNRGGVFLDGTPFSPQGTALFADNIIAYNDAGALLMPAVRGAVFSGNTFWENVMQVGVQGGGIPTGNDWDGNTWSDYAGFDADSDGIGDTPYRSERLFESLSEQEPRLQALIYSPVVQALELAAATFPVVRPVPKFTDNAPRIAPASLPTFITLAGSAHSALTAEGRVAHTSVPVQTSLGWLGLGMLCVVVAGGMSVRASYVAVRGKGGVPMHAVQQEAQTWAVHLARVSKSYGRTAVLQSVSVDIPPGEALALWGANGAGKSTLIKALLGLVVCTGEVAVAGYDVQRDGKRARRQVGYVPQETVFYDWTVRATLDFYARLKGVGRVRVDELMERLGLSAHAGKRVPALSGGLKQRLALALALLADPPVLLLDEPTASLDTQARLHYLNLLADLREQGKTVLFASHRLEEVEALADRVLVLEAGQAEVLSVAELSARCADLAQRLSAARVRRVTQQEVE